LVLLVVVLAEGLCAMLHMYVQCHSPGEKCSIVEACSFFGGRNLIIVWLWVGITSFFKQDLCLAWAYCNCLSEWLLFCW